MSLFGENSDWVEISDELWLEPKSTPKKLKLCADANVPLIVVEEIRQAGIPAHTAYKYNIGTHSDEAILAWVKRLKRVLLTLDRHFWDDKRFPLQNVPGIIFIDVPPGIVDNILKSFGLIYSTFACSYNLELWKGTKARTTPEGYAHRRKEGWGLGQSRRWFSRIRMLGRSRQWLSRNRQVLGRSHRNICTEVATMSLSPVPLPNC